MEKDCGESDDVIQAITHYSLLEVFNINREKKRLEKDNDHPFPSSHLEIIKLPCFDVEVPEQCLKKWKDCYGNYRVDMSLALQDNDRECKNEALKEVIKKYEKMMLKKFGL